MTTSLPSRCALATASMPFFGMPRRVRRLGGPRGGGLVAPAVPPPCDGDVSPLGLARGAPRLGFVNSRPARGPYEARPAPRTSFNQQEKRRIAPEKLQCAAEEQERDYPMRTALTALLATLVCLGDQLLRRSTRSNRDLRQRTRKRRQSMRFRNAQVGDSSRRR
jgi:hypothetical protein